MRDFKRIERILYKLGLLWVKSPDQRFFQLLFNFTRLGTSKEMGVVEDPFHYEDSEIECDLDEALRKAYKKGV